MANFLRSQLRKSDSAQKRLERQLSEISSDVARGLDSIRGVVTAVKKFFSAFGSETARLNELSRKRLTQMDAQQQNKLRERAIAETQAVTRQQLSDALERYARGRISIEALGESLRMTIRRQALTAAIIGVGGVGNLTENVLTAVRRAIANEFRLLDGFIDDIAGRDIEARDRARLAKYANTAYTLSQTAQRQLRIDAADGQELKEQRVLGSAEHCVDCLALAALGCVPAGELPPIGQDTRCGNSCRCSIVACPAGAESDIGSYGVIE